MPDKGQRWSREERLVVLDYYCRTPFGKLHERNPELIALAKLIGRTPAAVSMKAVNFASLDPTHRARGVKGLANVGTVDRALWDEFVAANNWEGLVSASATALDRFGGQGWPSEVHETPSDYGGKDPVSKLAVSDVSGKSAREEEESTRDIALSTESESLRKVRLAQRFFRQSVLGSYREACAFCDLKVLPLLVASHIIPWSVDTTQRVNPRNGISLCALHDRAFDRGLLSVGENLCILVAEKLKGPTSCELHQLALINIEGRPMTMPERFAPDPLALAHHRGQIFQR